MFKFIKVGRLLDEGITLYRQKEYATAKTSFSQALAFNSHDFTTTFWMARVFTMLNEYVKAQDLLIKCKEINPNLMEKLITPWEQLTARLNSGCILSLKEIDDYNKEIDNKLQDCYYKKNFTGREMFKISLIPLSVPFISGALHDFYGMLGSLTAGILVTITTLIYFHFSTILPLNLWFRYKWVRTELNRLFSIPSFRMVTIIYLVLFGIASLGHTMFIAQNPQARIEYILSLQSDYRFQSFWIMLLISVMVPIFEELIFRLAWYNYLAKYNKILAYIGVTILFTAAHFNLAIYIIIASIAFTWIYSKYQTIMASIVVHFLHNILASILFLAQLRILGL